MDKVAVIIPVYNTQATLARCIDSVLAQSMPASEIVIVDDGSPDDAASIALNYAALHPHIKVVRQPNCGLAVARRSGLIHSTAPLVMHLDSDDSLPCDAIEFLHGKLTHHDLDMAYGCFERHVPHRAPRLMPHSRQGVMSGEQYVKVFLEPATYKSLCCNLSKRSLWTPEVWPAVDERIPSEDYIINLRLAFNVQRVGFYNHPTYHYYLNTQSLSVAGSLWALDRWKVFFALIEGSLATHGLLEQNLSLLHSLKVYNLAFCTHDFDTSDPWVGEVLGGHCPGLSLKTRLLQRLLRYPRLLRALVATNRRLKALF